MNLKKVTLPEHVSTIEKSAFENCLNLKNINLESIVHIEAEAFKNCASLETIDLKQINTIDGNAFEKCSSLYTATIEGTLYSLSHKVFLQCENLKNVTLHQYAEAIGDSCFEDCYSLEEIKLPESLMTFPRNLFKNCINLRSVDMSNTNSKVSISHDIFENCQKLETVILPDGLDYIYSGFIKNIDTLKHLFIRGYDIMQINLSPQSPRTLTSYSELLAIISDFKDPNITRRIRDGMAAILYNNTKDKHAGNYIKKHPVEIFETLTKDNDISAIRSILSEKPDFITADNIDTMIDNARINSKLEIQVTLTRYKHDNFNAAAPLQL